MAKPSFWTKPQSSLLLLEREILKEFSKKVHIHSFENLDSEKDLPLRSQEGLLPPHCEK